MVPDFLNEIYQTHHYDVLVNAWCDVIESPMMVTDAREKKNQESMQQKITTLSLEYDIYEIVI